MAQSIKHQAKTGPLLTGPEYEDDEHIVSGIADAVHTHAGEDITSGTVADARVAATMARDSEVTAAVAAEATLARNADNLSSGTVADARIASTIARDSEVTSAVSAEATARDAAIETHRADTTVVHGIADTSALVLTGDSRLSDARTPTAHHASHEDGGADEISLTGLSGTPAALTTHEGASDPHPGYLTPAEGNAAYDASGAAAAVTTTSIGAVPTARTVTAGTGLTGGGDLSANRTVAADFGSGAGKVTQGNDSRLSDARTPTAHAASHKAGGSDDLSGVQNGFAPLTSGLLVPIANIPTGTSGTTVALGNHTHAGGVTIQFPALKPGTPTDDFAGAALDGAWSAHSNQGSFATTHCKTQGEDWSGSALEMQFSEQNGTIYQAHANTDLDFTIGGIRRKGLVNNSSTTMMIGIAALNTSGTGVGVTIYNDGSIYFATITTYAYSANSAGWALHGMVNGEAGGDWWLRLKRISGTWTGYASQSGRAWDKTFATRADSIVVAQLHFGILYNTSTIVSGRVVADFYQLDA